MAKPLWRRAFDAVERPVGARLERAVQTNAFAAGAATVLRTRAQVQRRYERTTRRALHRVNLPTATDVVLLRDQVVALERTVRRLEQTVRSTSGGSADDGTRGPGGPGAARRRAQPAASAQRREVPGGRRPPRGRADAEGDGLAP